MDCLAVASSPDALLQELGVVKKGDLYALRSMCTKELEAGEWDSKKKSLLDEFKQASSQRIKPREKKETTRKICLGWKHFNQKSEKYVVVFRSKGGGGEDLPVPQYATKEYLISEGKKIFFKDGKSRFFGNEEDNDFYLIDNTCTEVPNSFSVQDYIHANSHVSKIRLYLCTKSKIHFPSGGIKEDNGRKWRQTLHDCQEMYEKIDSSSDEEVTDANIRFDLIGSSATRSNLKAEQDKAFEESLKADQEKEKQKICEMDSEMREIERLEKIREARSRRVPIEPTPGKPSVQIVVQHSSQGRLKRLFSQESTGSGIYDWIGSLQIEPEDFELCVSNLDVSMGGTEAKISPSENIVKYNGCILHMKAREDPLPLDSEDVEVTFQSFGTSNVSDISNDTTVVDLMDLTPTVDLPSVIMEDDR